MNALVRKLDKFDATVAWINGEKQLFNKEITPFQELIDIKVHNYVKKCIYFLMLYLCIHHD